MMGVAGAVAGAAYIVAALLFILSLAGLSKLGRVVDAHARRLQIQERLTSGIVATIARVLRPKAAMAILEAEHTCMTLRGVRKEGSRLTTVAASGAWETDAAARREALLLLQGNGG